MYKKLLIAGFALASAYSVMAKPISPDVALQRMSYSGMAKTMSDSRNFVLTHTSRNADDAAVAYVFVPQNGDGFTVLSADDAAVPVLGYSDRGRFDKDNIPPAMKWWLEKLGEQTAMLGRNGNGEFLKPYAPSDMEAISPLLTTTWDQGSPYNRETPVISGVQSPTGCVATSVAQVMNYFKYPEVNKGIIKYYDGSTYRTLNLRSRGNFQWDKMLDSYSGSYTEEEADAVAYLMLAAGYSVQMNYRAESSGAVSFRIADALPTYFGYDKGIYYLEREYVSPQEWTKRIYDNLKNIGPVIYDGSSIDGGHSFVCDGYDGKGYFHFNWGWGGLSDGYFVLDSLNPESQGIGGAEGGFNYSQGVIFGIRKPTGENPEVNYDNIRIQGNLNGSINNGYVVFSVGGNNLPGWGNASYRDISCYGGIMIYKVDTEETYVQTQQGQFVSPGSTTGRDIMELGPISYYPTDRLEFAVKIPDGLADGTYKFVCAAKQSTVDDSPWQPMQIMWGIPNFVYVTVSNGNYTVQNAAASVLDFSDCKFTSPLYVNRNARLDFTVENNSDIDLTYCFSPELWKNGNRAYTGDMMLVTVNAHETIEKQSLVAFYLSDGASGGSGEYELRILDRNTGEYLGTYGTYDMSYVSANLKVVLDDLSVSDSNLETVNADGRNFEAYVAANSSDFDVNFKYTVESGYLDSSVRILAARYDTSTKKFVNFPDNIYYSTPFLGSGDSEEVNLNLDFSGYDHKSVYRLAASYMEDGKNKTLGIIYVTFLSNGIDDVQMDLENNATYYNLNGVRVDKPCHGEIYVKKTQDKVEVIRF